MLSICQKSGPASGVADGEPKNPHVSRIEAQRSGFAAKKEEGRYGYGAFGKAGSGMEYFSSDAVSHTLPDLFEG